MRDRTVGDTFYMFFTTRAFATGIPTVLSGTPVVSAYEDNSLTQITAGITLGVDHDSVVGLNLLTIVATGGNGYETVKDYSMVITTGTVGGVSVVGEVVGEFSLSLSAAAKDLANGTDGLTALKTGIDDVPTVSEFNARTLVAASYFDPAADAVANVTLVATTTALTNVINASSVVASVSGSVDSVTGDTKQTADHTAAIADIPTVAEFNARTLVAASYFDPAADTVANVTLCATTTALTNVINAASVVASVSGNVDGSVDSVTGDTKQTADHTAGIADIPTVAEFNARTLVAASYFDPAADTVANVTTVATTTTNTDMVAEPATLLTTQMTEAYAADGTAPTVAQALFLIQQTIGDFSIAGTTITTKRLNGSTTAATYTLDDGTSPTSRTRTT